MSDDHKPPKPPRIRKDGQPDRRNPPQQHRFQPGQSGNPQGKKKRMKTVAEDVHAVLSRPVKVRRGQTEETVTTLRAAIESVLQTTIKKGDHRSLRALIDLMPPAAPAEEGAERKELSARLVDLLVAAATAKKNGVPFSPFGEADADSASDKGQ
jgi:hypothetical protein